ncbi:MULTISPECIES: aspartate/glutamate racemase family protein [unclassified Variovorax]|uniref:aspartate/glutamate racemase family protein n=1 Tax=unclassified Variovorax TaxID=663243 RepID=UPI0008CE21A6|nr:MULTISPECIES: aspartate/glutamate racemase family protein [unclassified Variovorax]SEK14946.1 Asp/Glu/hydantoin racemase [Variovorax sp. OK202]SFE06820.1 Asp/Glu/hydantoin racemase [Variovorax sp. OK212]
MTDILLINPNASSATTEMMAKIANAEAPAGCRVTGRTAMGGPSMIVNERELEAAAVEVLKVWRDAGTTQSQWDGVIVSAFGDPGIDLVRANARVPVVGIAEASMREASQGQRRFGIATVTPDLVAPIEQRARALGLLGLYTGIRLTQGDPRELAAEPQALEEALARAVQRCIDEDGAQAVIIGGGPLGQAALALAPRFGVPVIAPISAAMRQLCARLEVAS